MVEVIIFTVIGVLLSILGMLFFKGKFLNLIAGYNGLSVVEKSKINKVKLGRIVGKFIIIFGVVTIFIGVLTFKNPCLTNQITIAYAVFVTIITVVLVVRLSKKQLLEK